VKARAALACVCVLSLILSGATLPFVAAAQETGMSGGPPPPAGAVPLPAPERDPAARSARSTECAQKADAEGLQGKIRKHFLHQCKSGG
jgi:hypothetical protein